MKGRRTHIVAATTLFASLLWISVNLGDTFQTVMVVPLSVTGLPPAMALQSQVPRSLHLRFRGEGWRLAALHAGGEQSCAMDVTSLLPGQWIITGADVIDRLSIPAGVELIAMVPDSIPVAFDSLASRRVVVVPDLAVTFRDRYGRVGPVQVEPESVTVSGASSVLAAITSWKTATAVYRDLKAPLDVTVPVAPAERHQLEITPASVRIRMEVQWFAEKIVSGVRVEVHSVPPHREVILVPPRVELIVRGGVERLGRVGPDDIRASLDYGTILSDTTGSLAPEILAPPELQVVSRRPERVQYIVRKRL